MLALVLCLAGTGAESDPGTVDAVFAVRTIRPGEIIAPVDVKVGPSGAEGVLRATDSVLGLAARRLLVAGRPIGPDDVGPPHIVRRNVHVSLVFVKGGLSILAEGRALSDGAEGDRIRAMNLASRQIITGTVAANGSVEVGGWQ